MKTRIIMMLLLLLPVISYAQKDKVFEFTVEGMTCNGCANTATQALLKMEGVERLLLEYPELTLKKVDIVSWKSDLSKQLTKEYKMPSLPFILIFSDKGKLLGKVEGNYIDRVEQIIKQN